MRKLSKSLPIGIGLLCRLAFANSALARTKGAEDPVRDKAIHALDGKSVVLIPSSMAAGAQALTDMIAEKPAVIVLHSPDLQTYSPLIAQAQAAGIYRVQNNMRSQQACAAYVGADCVDVGQQMTTAVINACRGKSNKIAVVQGMPTAAVSADSLKGVENLLVKNPQTKVVSLQAADWVAAKAKTITQAVLKQHPYLCGFVSFWDGMDVGTAAAVKAGVFNYNLSHDVPAQGSRSRLHFL